MKEREASRVGVARRVDRDLEIIDVHEAEGRAAGLPKGRALELLQDMTDRLGPALERTLMAVGDQVPAAVSEPIASDALQRAVQVRDLI